MPRPDVSAATRYAAPRRLRRDAACRAPMSLPRYGMPCPDVSAAMRFAVSRETPASAALPISTPPREPV